VPTGHAAARQTDNLSRPDMQFLSFHRALVSRLNHLVSAVYHLVLKHDPKKPASKGVDAGFLGCAKPRERIVFD
jgi:hypothetical protein